MGATDRLRLSARWLLPVGSPPIEHGVLEIEAGRIRAVHAAGPADIDFGNAAILPGLVNCHTHLDLTGMSGMNPPRADACEWLRQVILFRGSVTPNDVTQSISQGLDQCLRHGTTLVGDVSGDGRSWSLLNGSPIRAVVFREMLGLPKDRAERSWQQAQVWLGQCSTTERCRPGLSPHAPYSTRTSLIRAAGAVGVPVAIHLAEFREERELLEEQQGPFVSFLQELGVWDPLGLARSPEHVIRLFSAETPTLLVHGNYLAATAPIPQKATVVYCPRTHEAFGHTPHPVANMFRRGVRVVLGTDSLASNPDLSILAEMRFLHAVRPDVPCNTILQMGTIFGAEALGWAADVGTLEAGKAADFIVVALPNENGDPLELLLESYEEVKETWIAGQCVFRLDADHKDSATAQQHSHEPESF